MIQDIRYAVRILIKTPVYTSIVVLTMALGIGANTAIFSVVNDVLLRPLPYANPDQLTLLRETNPRQATDQLNVSPANFLDWREQNQTFEALAAFRYWGYVLTGTTEPERLRGMRVSADFFQILRVEPAIGRLFLKGEDESGAEPVIIMGHGLWQRRFGGDPNLVGQSVVLDGQNYTVAGILPADFQFRERPVDVWVPLVFQSYDLQSRDRQWLQVLGRLKPDVSMARAQSDMDVIARRLAEQHPESNGNRGIGIQSLHAALTGDLRPTLPG